ncbi:MAG: hypothetical protein EXS48_01375 [Candidatus Staskawiczbacteria bacterium]|nr:hypothetical protein [Candidatus Staskawiczbacteria bacterium]
MINQQLIDYIKEQLNMGVAKENIKTALISQGWLEQDINEGFMTVERSVVAPVPPAPEQPVSPIQSTVVVKSNQNTIWTKGIPRTNMVFMIISLLLVFGLDLLIIISSPELSPFWFVMLGVLAVFAVFVYLENFIFSKKFAGTTSALDKWITIIICIRNVIFVLNFIPLIQLLGLAIIGGIFAIIPFGGRGGGFDLLGLGGGLGAFGMIGPFLLITYIILIICRFAAVKQKTR